MVLRFSSKIAKSWGRFSGFLFRHCRKSPFSFFGIDTRHFEDTRFSYWIGQKNPNPQNRLAVLNLFSSFWTDQRFPFCSLRQSLSLKHERINLRCRNQLYWSDYTIKRTPPKKRPALSPCLIISWDPWLNFNFKKTIFIEKPVFKQRLDTFHRLIFLKKHLAPSCISAQGGKKDHFVILICFALL